MLQVWASGEFALGGRLPRLSRRGRDSVSRFFLTGGVH